MTELANRINQIRWEITDAIAKQHHLTKQQTEDAHSLVEEVYYRCLCHADWSHISCVVCDWLEELGDYEINETDIDNLAQTIEI